MVVRKCDLIYPDLASSSFEACRWRHGRPHQMLTDAFPAAAAAVWIGWFLPCLRESWLRGYLMYV